MRNAVKAGAAVPVKFSLNGNQGLGIMAAGFPTSQAVTCATGATLDAIEETVSAGGSTLSYDAAADRYVYVWKTAKSWTGCRELRVRLIDGTEKTATFQFQQ